MTKMTNYTTKEIKTLRNAIREGNSLSDVAKRFSKEFNRTYAGVYLRVCKEAKSTRRRKAAVVSPTKVVETQQKSVTFNIKSVEIVGNKVTFNF
jgi:dsRNA-specific ribonuclease